VLRLTTFHTDSTCRADLVDYQGKTDRRPELQFGEEGRKTILARLCESTVGKLSERLEEEIEKVTATDSR
jgi:hypothetical protein